ncbi:hypothetical protein C8R44DRAFT_851754 [Mycena epipterygia]|nr:hypothetical protein C8R44DRAFT_851754 [Mycena epipterygia]
MAPLRSMTGQGGHTTFRFRISLARRNYTERIQKAKIDLDLHFLVVVRLSTSNSQLGASRSMHNLVRKALGLGFLDEAKAVPDSMTSSTWQVDSPRDPGSLTDPMLPLCTIQFGSRVVLRPRNLESSSTEGHRLVYTTGWKQAVHPPSRTVTGGTTDSLARQLRISAADWQTTVLAFMNKCDLGQAVNHPLRACYPAPHLPRVSSLERLALPEKTAVQTLVRRDQKRGEPSMFDACGCHQKYAQARDCATREAPAARETGCIAGSGATASWAGDGCRGVWRAARHLFHVITHGARARVSALKAPDTIIHDSTPVQLAADASTSYYAFADVGPSEALLHTWGPIGCPRLLCLLVVYPGRRSVRGPLMKAWPQGTVYAVLVHAAQRRKTRCFARYWREACQDTSGLGLISIVFVRPASLDGGLGVACTEALAALYSK